MMRDQEKKKELMKANRTSVLEATEKLIRESTQTNACILFDHKTGEVADFVVVYRDQDELFIKLYHCKSSSQAKPGARQKDAYEVLGQARKCLRWLNNSLFEVLAKHMVPNRCLLGTKDDFYQIVGNSTPQSAKKTINIVQPGFDHQEIKTCRDASIRLMLLSTYEELRDQDIGFRVLCS